MYDVDGAALLHLCTKLRIVNQETGAMTPFLPNEGQVAIVDLVTSSLSSIILKSRQIGASTILLAYDLAFAIANPGIPCTLALDTDDNAKKMLGQIRAWCERDLGLVMRVASEHVLVLPNGSRIQAVTSGSRAAQGQSRTGRSGSAGLIHVSELAFWTNDQKTFQSLTSTALKNARIVVESTATPTNNLFRNLWSRATTDDDTKRNAFASLFLSLERHVNYRLDPSSISDARWAQLRDEEGFSRRDTAAWFDAQLQGRFAGDIYGLRQEYPPTAEAAFSIAIGRWIKAFTRAPVVAEKPGNPWRFYRLWKDVTEPVAMGVDVAKGTGGDYSAIVIMGYESRDIIATWYSNTTSLPEFTDEIHDAFKTFRPRGAAIESTGIGAQVFQEAAQWGFAGLREQNTSSTNGEKQWRLTRLKWSIERGVTRCGPDMALEIEGSDKVAPSVINDDGDYVGRDDLLNAASFALKVIEAEPWVRSEKTVDPHAVLAPASLHRRRRSSGI